jgi:manganese transport system substrate-binding protein
MTFGVVVGCSAPVPTQQAESKKVLTTFTILADMARNVAGDNLTIESITKVGTEIHGYEPTPQDIARAQGATLILDNGLNLEAWAERFYSNLKGVARATLSEGITTIPIKTGDYQGKPNPHAWMSPRNALIYVENIRKAFTKIDPDRANIYQQNASNYSQKIKDLDQKLQATIAVLPPPSRFIVTCEGAFSYLAQDYNLQEIYIWAVNSDAQGTPQQIANVITQVRKHKVPAVFCESTVSDRNMRQIATQTGARYGGVFYVDSLTAPDGDAPNFLALLEYNINTLIKGLQNA